MQLLTMSFDYLPFDYLPIAFWLLSFDYCLLTICLLPIAYLFFIFFQNGINCDSETNQNRCGCQSDASEAKNIFVKNRRIFAPTARHKDKTQKNNPEAY